MRDFNIQKIPKPFWEGKIPNSPLDLEIGCGVGFHPIQYALANPNRNLLAIERTSEKFEKFYRRYLNHNKIPNLTPIHADAINWVTHYLDIQQLDRVFILYPNPYPKDPQKRFFQMPFMKFLISRIGKNGIITLATNEEFYYQESKDLGVKQWGLKLIEDRILLKEEKPRTHFEKKYLLRNDKCYNLVFKV